MLVYLKFSESKNNFNENVPKLWGAGADTEPENKENMEPEPN